MGIPALFRWLSTKYPKISTAVVEEQAKEIDGQAVPVDITKPNPNGVEFDNLYLDMNGIIHPCCHPEDKPAPKTEEEMYVEIFKYIDRIVAMIRPRKILYMAIDGVAPRAKMNQQRSRRFRASLEAMQAQEEESKLRKEWEISHNEALPEKPESEHFDSNCITPGTPFMSNLAIMLRYYVTDRLNNDPGWKNLKVILSDASVPGEGEHKIMDYIRRQRSTPEHDPNTRHVLYGLDADLIMLALATHEPHFKILREDVFFKQGGRGCFICGQEGHMAADCTGKPKEKNGEHDEKGAPIPLKPFVFLHVHILREYLEVELKCTDLPFHWDLERAIDDWVFLCFFVGNDFLPHLPSLEIREGAIDKLIDIWKKNLPVSGGYLTDHGDIDLSRAEMLLTSLGEMEDEIFRKRKEDEERRKEAKIRRDKEQEEQRQRQKRARMAASVPAVVEAMQDIASYPVNMSQADRGRLNKEQVEKKRAVVRDLQEKRDQGQQLEANRKAAELLKASLMETVDDRAPAQPDSGDAEPVEASDIASEANTGPDMNTDLNTDLNTDKDATQQSAFAVSRGLKRGAEDGPGTTDGAEPEVNGAESEADDDDDDDTTAEVNVVPLVTKKPKAEPVSEDPPDNIRLWESGWKERYYQNKFGVDLSDQAFREGIAKSYVEGFCWVLKYYYQGCSSWEWYYPYHYSPFASDFFGIGKLKIEFKLGAPFNPVEQLMGVLPAASRAHIPKAFHSLMTEEDSPIIDFYPTRFPIDLNGKKFAWQGVALLPFIDQDRLLAAMKTRYHLLTMDEVERNTRGKELLFLGESHPAFESLYILYGKKVVKEPVALDSHVANMTGCILPDASVVLPGSTFESPLSELGLPDVKDVHSISVVYEMPKVDKKFEAKLLPNVLFPPRELNADDYWWITTGVKRGGRGGGRGGRGGRGGGRGGGYGSHTTDGLARHDNGYRSTSGFSSYTHHSGGSQGYRGSGRGGYHGPGGYSGNSYSGGSHHQSAYGQPQHRSSGYDQRGYQGSYRQDYDGGRSGSSYPRDSHHPTAPSHYSHSSGGGYHQSSSNYGHYAGSQSYASSLDRSTSRHGSNAGYRPSSGGSGYPNSGYSSNYSSSYASSGYAGNADTSRNGYGTDSSYGQPYRTSNPPSTIHQRPPHQPGLTHAQQAAPRPGPPMNLGWSRNVSRGASSRGRGSSHQSSSTFKPY
ncbi:XRN 5'-3' exonuclease N-terminus-domain-containing protein [Polychytrium aggregatum]|uniref:XRN 5'-3' exonuclease N-terminus-domain-containing protein n=1 Tax=Polychytrium aggregatum TaxID=110093 RepID=UPI0022FE89AA|nr:XRN 5'-3' exonuclease N-terminus-domain-containing protein [Polychytrium aggregatum]KAI9207923.1 XRN 5'-3' exonuclease N-terminus-domain-containing protein [Polychytrium aggregatum]